MKSPFAWIKFSAHSPIIGLSAAIDDRCETLEAWVVCRHKGLGTHGRSDADDTNCRSNSKAVITIHKLTDTSVK